MPSPAHANEEKKFDYPKVEQPEGLDVTLYPHQLTTIYNMEKLERERKTTYTYNYGGYTDTTYTDTEIGVLGDDPGYGKTLSVIGLISRDKMPWDHKKKHIRKIPTYGDQSMGLFNCFRVKEYECYNCDLIVCSPSIIKQWESEMDKSNLSYHTVNNKKDMEKIKINTFDVILVSSNQYNDFVTEYKKCWRRFIYDEAASNHIPSMLYADAGFYWFVTATYHALRKVKGRGVHMISRIFSGIPDNILSTLLVRNDPQYVKASYVISPPTIINHVCINPGIVNAVGGNVPKEVLDMLSAGDVAGAVGALGGEGSDIMSIVMKRKEKELMEAEQKVELWTKQNNTKLRDEWTLRVAEVKKKIDELTTKYKNMVSEDCNICYESMSKPIMFPCCQNIICGGCVKSLTKGASLTCPFCRANNKLATLIPVETDEDKKVKKNKKDSPKDKKGKKNKKKSAENEVLSKPDTVVKIIGNGEDDDRFILFSNYDASFTIIKRALKDAEIGFVEIKGAKKTRENNIEKFRNGDAKVLFLNGKFNGSGINLQFANNIIFYHEVEDHIRQQNVGRIERIGKVGSLTIHNLI
jgi:SNF2 family DNA or RNA helicase